MHVFGWWEKARVPRGVPGKNQCRQGENMQTPHRKARCRLKQLMVDLNPGPSCCEATVLPLSVRLKIYYEFCLDICKSTEDDLHLLCNISGQNHSQFGLLCLIITVPSGNDKGNPKSIISIIRIPKELQLSLICNIVQETNFYFWIKRCLK